MGAGWSEVGVEGVPLELVYRVLRHVSLRDLTTLSATCKYLRTLIDESPLLWSHVHTQELWPNEKTWHWFERAAQCGNVGASIKLAVALLYNEGVVLDAKPVGNGELAVTLFERLETGGSLWPRSQLWLLYRPPWGAQPLCCKRYVHTRISHIAQMTGASWANRVLSRITEVTGENENPHDPTAINWIKVAAMGNDMHARLLQWRSRYERRHLEGSLDPGTELQASRELRELCLTGYYPTALTLAQFLASSRLSSNQCLPEIREFFQNSPPSRTWCALNYQQHVTPHMHHVLVDWLCEVTNMKLHASKVIHAATQIVEAYLNVEQVKCHQLQLVGITAVLLATRFIPGASILTIREASWVTDNTYSYNHVVRTVGHIMAALKANLAFPTILDYATVLLESVRAPEVTQEWTRFLCDLATTCAFPPRTTLAQIASSCVMLGYILSRLPWPNLPAVSGFTQHQLLQPALIIYSKSFDFKCRRQGIIDRYSMPAFSNMQVGRKPVPLLEDLLASLGLSEADYLHMVVMPSSLGDEAGISAMETDGLTIGARCSGVVYRTQQLEREEQINRVDYQEKQLQKQSEPSSSDSMNSSICDRNSRNVEVRAGGAHAISDIKPSASERPDDSRMDFSDSEMAHESPDFEPSNPKDVSCMRVEGRNGAAGESLTRRHYQLSEGGTEGVCALNQEQASCNLRNPGGIQEVNLMPSEDMLETLSETTSSEESSDLLSQTCEDGETNYARVSLKRKLENASTTERPEKCLILDVDNLQLD